MTSHKQLECYTIHVRTVSEANISEHWTKKRQRHIDQQFLVRAAMRPLQSDQPRPLPCRVRLIRLAPGHLDSDNLQMAFKWIRDEVSEILIPQKWSYQGKKRTIRGRVDDDPRIIWEYDQERGSAYCIRIEIIFDDVGSNTG